MPKYHGEDDITQILPLLFLGNQHSSKQIKQYDIKCVINATVDLPNYDKSFNVHYLRVPISNRHQYITLFQSYLPLCYMFIDHYINNGQRILVHCKNGHKRSVLVVAHYIAQKYKMKLENSLKYIRKKRPYIFRENETNKIVLIQSIQRAHPSL